MFTTKEPNLPPLEVIDQHSISEMKVMAVSRRGSMLIIKNYSGDPQKEGVIIDGIQYYPKTNQTSIKYAFNELIAGREGEVRIDREIRSVSFDKNGKREVMSLENFIKQENIPNSAVIGIEQAKTMLRDINPSQDDRAALNEIADQYNLPSGIKVFGSGSVPQDKADALIEALESKDMERIRKTFEDAPILD